MLSPKYGPLLLDHIIILLPHSTLLHSLTSTLTSQLTITPGGTHANNLTQNKLITFLDGSYIELIAFLPDADPSRHDWGAKSPGSIIDFALTTKKDVKILFSELSARLERAGLKDGNEVFGYDSPHGGGRKREDGVELNWNVTFPKKPAVRGEVPFFCHDVPSTARPLRVPGEKENTTHPSNIYGVRSLSIMVSPNRVDGLVEKYTAILRTSPKVMDGKDGASFELGSVHEVSAGDGVNMIALNVCTPLKEWEKKRVEESGYAIGLVLGARDGSKLVDYDLDLGSFFLNGE